MNIKAFILLLIVLLSGIKGFSHPMPHSLLLLDVKDKGISAELSLPLKELQIAFPQEDFDKGYQTLIQRRSQWLDAYLLQHMSVTDTSGRPWHIAVLGKNVSENEQFLTGTYHELSFKLWLQAPPGSSPRHFIMHYDVIMHQLVTHKLFIRLHSDWYGGMTPKDILDADLGVLSVNPASGATAPVIIDLDEGSTWKGFYTMIQLGMDHIAAGTDHLLFLLMLLLPATLQPVHKRWGTFTGVKQSMLSLLKIATAFTIGHSVSLFLGATKLLTLPQQPVEIAIAFTILISAIHVIRPLFFRKELFVAMGFGLIHGLAFSGVLSEMNLDGSRLAWSILGFNAGIELMQLFIILCLAPWLIILSRNNFYRMLRLAGGSLGIIAALGWLAERITNKPNYISTKAEMLLMQGKWIILLFALLAIISELYRKNKSAFMMDKDAAEQKRSF